MRRDSTTWIGLGVGLLAIFIGQLLEGGHISALLQGTAALIVAGGTVGAVVVSNSAENLRRGWQMAAWAFRASHDEKKQLQVGQEIIDCAHLVRKESVIALEKRINSLSHPFLRRAMRLVVDGVDANSLREICEAEIDLYEERLNAGAKIWLDAGGFAPTIGIIGAVLGLIHVMANLTDTSKLGAGIAVAFVATVYGVASANLLFLPLGNKLKAQVKHRVVLYEMIMEGTLGLVAGLSPVVIQHKVQSFTPDHKADLNG